MIEVNEFFDGFSWAIPTVFGGCLNECRFEKGDVLYDSRAGYQKWGDAVKQLKFSLQIKFPGRSEGRASGAAGTDSEKTFVQNWRSRVVIDLTNYETEKTAEMNWTQGKLYTLLWKGLFESHGPSDPPVPIVLKELAKALQPATVDEVPGDLGIAVRHAVSWISAYFGKAMTRPGVCVMAFDLTNPISAEKFQAVREQLGRVGTVVERVFSCKEVGLDNLEIAPTLRLAGFGIQASKTEAVMDALRGALYKGTKDRFRLETHGLLLVDPQ
jgi:hypothetical protein